MGRGREGGREGEKMREDREREGRREGGERMDRDGGGERGRVESVGDEAAAEHGTHTNSRVSNTTNTRERREEEGRGE